MTRAAVGFVIFSSLVFSSFAPVVMAATESANNAVVYAGQTSVIVDAQGSSWAIVSGVVKKNGVNAGYSAGVVRLAYVNDIVWQENANHLWWSWGGTMWIGASGITQSPLPVSPFAGQTLYRNTWSNALTQSISWQTSRVSDATKMTYLASQPTAVWFGDWNSDIEKDVRKYVDAATAAGQLPVLVAYNIPNRDCGSWYSSGGVSSASAYHDWMVKVANGINSRKAIVILEPDAVALDCFTPARGGMLMDAVYVLESQPNVAVYIDAGHPDWTPAATMATRLQQSGISKAEGFALNVSNFYSTSSNIAYGNDLSARVGGKHYVIDTSRNANGWQGEWCNPQGAGIGARPTVSTGQPLFDAGLWVKAPGDSDGYCNGGPAAGSWWSGYAVNLYNQGTR